MEVAGKYPDGDEDKAQRTQASKRKLPRSPRRKLASRDHSFDDAVPLAASNREHRPRNKNSQCQQPSRSGSKLSVEDDGRGKSKTGQREFPKNTSRGSGSNSV